MASDDFTSHLKGTTTFFEGQFDAKSVTITICCALAIYNALELLLLIFTTFRRYSGLYFWSLVVASVGIIPYTTGFMIGYFQLTAQLAGEIISTVGWPMMVSGQSLVLYSRLGLVLGPTHGSALKATKWMIIIDAIVFHISTSVVFFGAFNAKPNYGFAKAYEYIEKIQMTGFTIQEFVLSGLYVWRTLDILKTSPDWSNRRRRVMRELLSINILIILMDIALLVIEYQNRHVFEQAVKAVVYSVKLKLEFAILSKLVGITQRSESGFTLGTDMAAEEGNEKADALHIERTTSYLSGTTYRSENTATHAAPSLSLVASSDQHKRELLEEDTYASYCRKLTATQRV